MADNNLLEALSKAVGVETTTSKILSNGKTATLKTINVKQQKEILKTALEGLLSPISFYTVANQIIKNNLTENIELLTVDRPLILLNLRKNSVGDEYELSLKDEKIKIKISDLIEKANLVTFSFNEYIKDITHGDITIVTKLPTLDEDTSINIQLKKLFEKVKDEDKLKEIVGELFVVELIKFIKAIKFTSEGKENIINFNDLSLEQKIKAFESIPMSLNYDFVNFVKKFRTLENSILEIDHKGEKINIPLDSSFFFKE
ncbi:MAG: hypothetical protein EBS46_02445 [Proteobacteria bacterium]|nr:hypothetical protein [Candidatus Fonsibacter sp. PEL4]